MLRATDSGGLCTNRVHSIKSTGESLGPIETEHVRGNSTRRSLLPERQMTRRNKQALGQPILVTVPVKFQRPDQNKLVFGQLVDANLKIPPLTRFA